MQEAVPIGKGGMLAILGQKISEIEKYLKNISPGGICEIANDNAEGQTIVSGNSQGIDELTKILIREKREQFL